jgi:hypothetical protein
MTNYNTKKHLDLDKAVLELIASHISKTSVVIQESTLLVISNFKNIVEMLGDKISPELQKEINSIVITLQFQDNLTQIVENLICIIKQLTDHHCELEKNPEAGNEGNINVLIEEIFKSIKLSEMRKDLQKKLIQYNLLDPASTDNSTLEDSNESELF